MRLYFTLCILLLSIQIIFCQEYSIFGRLKDNSNANIYSASIILLNQNDSSFVQGTISDSSGYFAINHIKSGEYELSVQHLLYKNKNLKFSVHNSLNLDTIVLSANKRELSAVNIKAARPVVKLENNILTYNAKVISEEFVRTNAFEVLGDVPGVILQGDQVQLVGANKLNIAINGKLTTLSSDQIIAMLKSMPNKNVKEVQVMYAPPAKYNVKGSLINIVLNKANTNQYNGSVTAGFRQRSHAGCNGGITLQTSTQKMDFNLMYSGDYDYKELKYQMDIAHNYNNAIYQIDQQMSFQGKTYDHHLQLATDIHLDTLNTLSFSYLGNYSKDKSGPGLTNSKFMSEDIYYTELDTSSGNSPGTMHNLKLEYNLAEKVEVGFDYTYYNNPATDDYVSVVDNERMVYRTQSEQTVNKWMGFINHTIQLAGLPLTYGVNYTFTGNSNFYSYYDYDGGYVIDDSQSTNNDYSESELSGFVSFSKQFNDKFSMDFSLRGENSKMQKDTLKTSVDLWNTFKLYPGVNLSYVFDKAYKNMLTFYLKSYVNYPSYWQLSPATWYTNQYMLIKGNPELQPYQTYETEINYILKRKYVFLLSYTYIDGMISQIPYASSQTFNTIAENKNIDFNQEVVAAMVLPIQITDYLKFNPTFVYKNRHMKNTSSEDENFERSANTFLFYYDTSISFCKRYGLKGNLSGYYHSGTISTIYDVKSSYDFSYSMSCNLLKDKAVLTLKMKDIFNSNSPETDIHFGNQNSVYHFDRDTRMFLVNFRYNFGKAFKEKKIKVDQSRFKRIK